MEGQLFPFAALGFLGGNSKVIFPLLSMQRYASKGRFLFEINPLISSVFPSVKSWAIFSRAMERSRMVFPMRNPIFRSPSRADS
ncbi:hypothetical protein VT98_13173, partial [Candidatus Electrothrix communis]